MKIGETQRCISGDTIIGNWQVDLASYIVHHESAATRRAIGYKQLRREKLLEKPNITGDDHHTRDLYRRRTAVRHLRLHLRARRVHQIQQHGHNGWKGNIDVLACRHWGRKRWLRQWNTVAIEYDREGNGRDSR